MAYTVPNFLMGATAQADFSPVQNALAQWSKDRQFNARMAQQDRQFNAQNALAQAHLGIAQRSANRADQMSPLQMELLKAQVQEAQTGLGTAPLRRDLLAAQTELARAQARAAGSKDAFNELILRQFGGAPPNALAPPAAEPQLQPQSFGGSADPMLIPTQAGPEPGPQAQADTVDVPGFGRMPTERARALGMAAAAAGKGDLGKLITEEVNRDQLDKTARGEVEKDLVGLTNTIGRLESIEKRFDPKFLEIPTRAGMAWSSLAEKFGSLPQEQKAALERYTKFRQTSVQNAALYVKYLSGVAVSEQEFKRIMTTLPNAGSGVLDGDSPTEFKAKMREATTQSKMAYARAHYLIKNGFKGKPWEAGIALDDVRELVDQRAAQLQQQLQGRVPPERMGPIIRQKLKDEFGI